jgi:hypothetical protein
MTEIFVSTDDVKVIGGTANVNVEVDFGPKGDRGSLFLVGYGDPNTIVHSQTLQLLDLYINVQVTDDDYLFMYQYVNQGGVNTWVRFATLTTDKFSSIRRVNFTNGKASSNVDFKVSNIVPESLLASLTESSFNIQCTFQNAENPVAHSIIINPITIQAATGDLTLPIGINAAEFSDGEWSGINGLHVLHFLITVV